MLLKECIPNAAAKAWDSLISLSHLHSIYVNDILFLSCQSLVSGSFLILRTEKGVGSGGGHHTNIEEKVTKVT